MNDFTFLTEEQIWGSNNTEQLEILKKYGVKCAITDFAILLGGYVSNNNYTSEGNNLKDRTCVWWSASDHYDANVRVAANDGNNYWNYPNLRDVAARPALPFSNNHDISPNGVRGRFGVLEVEDPEGRVYPQKAVDERLGRILEREHQARRLKTTGRGYTPDSIELRAYNQEFNPEWHPEFEYNEKQYVRVIARPYGNSAVLSNGVSISSGNAVWAEVQPIRGFLDEKSKRFIPKKSLYAGVQFDIKTSEYEASAIKIYNELRFAVECTKNQMAPKEYILGEKYKRVPANAFNGINGLEKVVLQSQIQEIGDGAFEGFSYVSKQRNGKLVVSKDRIQDVLWEFNIGDRELIHISTDSLSRPTIYTKNKYGNVDLVTEIGEKRNVCDINTFEELKKQDLIEALVGWISLRDEYKSKSPLFIEVLLASDGNTKLYKKLFESKITGFDHLIKREWYSALSNESKEDLMKLFISLGGFEKTGQKNVLIAIDKLQEAYGKRFDDELHHLFMDVPKGDKHIFGTREGKEGIFSFSKTILNFLKKYEGQYRSDEFKKTITAIVSNCPKVYQAYRKYLRNLNQNYPEAINPDANLYEKAKSEGLSSSFILQWLSSEKYVYLDNEKLKRRLMHLPQGIAISKAAALHYEQLLDRDIPQIIESVKSGQRKRNKYFVNQIDDGREVRDDNSSGIHYEWAEINKTNALTCGEFMQTCFRFGRQNRYAFWNCIDNPEDAFMLLYDNDYLAGYCRVRYYPDKKGILVDNIELSHYAGDVFTDNQRREFAEKSKKGLLDMAHAMNEIGYPVEQIYSKQDSWADKIILDEWKKEHDTVDKLKNVNAMQEATYNSPRESGSYNAGNVGEQIVIMEDKKRGRKL